MIALKLERNIFSRMSEILYEIRMGEANLLDGDQKFHFSLGRYK